LFRKTERQNENLNDRPMKSKNLGEKSQKARAAILLSRERDRSEGLQNLEKS